MGDFVADFTYPKNDQLINYNDNVVLSYTSNYSSSESINLKLWSRKDGSDQVEVGGPVYTSSYPHTLPHRILYHAKQRIKLIQYTSSAIRALPNR